MRSGNTTIYVVEYFEQKLSETLLFTSSLSYQMTLVGSYSLLLQFEGSSNIYSIYICDLNSYLLNDQCVSCSESTLTLNIGDTYCISCNESLSNNYTQI